MCKLIDKCRRSLSARAGLLTWGVVVFIAMAALAAQGQPTNDNFANATMISGPSGTTNGSNVGATSETGEPNDEPDNVGGPYATVWYQWTSPITGTIEFNTEGSTFDTVMGVYTGTNVTNLTLITANDDINFPSDLTSQVTFPVTNGGVYNISVDGFGGAMGSVTLTWLPVGGLSAGQFSFASGVSVGGAPGYVFSENEVDWTVMETHMTVNGARARVTRTGGSAGYVHVGYIVTNSFYTNIFMTNIFGTNIFATNMTTMTNWTNVFVTNVASFNFFGDNQAGASLTCTFLGTNSTFSGSTITITNDDSGFFSRTVTNYTIPLIAPIPCRNTTSFGFVTNSSGGVTNIIMLVTNAFCTNIVVTNISPAATPFVDYLPVTGVVDFQDYQMAMDIPLQINRTGSFKNRLVEVVLTSVTLDALEATNSIAPPTISANSNALVNVLAQQIIGTGQFNSGVPIPPCSTTNLVFNFDKAVWTCTEGVNGLGTATVWVVRDGYDANATGSVEYDIDWSPGKGPDGNDNFPLQPGSDYATPDNPLPDPLSSQPADFTSVTGTLTFAATQPFASISIPIVDDTIVEFNEDMHLRLHDPSGGLIGQIGTATLTILFDDQPAGAVDRDYNPDNNLNTPPVPNNANPGANNTTYACVVQPDGLALIAGDFTAYNTIPRNSIARIQINGLLDSSFLAPPNKGASGTINCMALDTNNNIYIGGTFTAFNGTNLYSIAHLNSDGSLDLGFNPGVGVQIGQTNGTVTSMALQPDGRLVIAGNFTMVNATNRNNVARFNTNGSLDTTFDPGVGPNATINALVLQHDGKLVIGGEFSQVDGTPRQGIARLNTDGTLDASFDPGLGIDPNTAVYALAEQTDGRVLIGGSFNTFNLINSKSLARLNIDGSLDSSFNPGQGADNTIYSITLQSDATILIGGLFTSYNETRRIGIARLLTTGALDTSFMDVAYNQFAGVINTYYNTVVEPKNSVNCIAVQADGNVLIGGSYSYLGGGFVTNAAGTIIPARDSSAPRQNFARLIGNNTGGPGNIGMVYTNYTADEDGGNSYVTLARSNGHLGPAGVTVSATDPPAGPGAAVSGTDYTFNTNDANPVFLSSYGITWMMSDGIFGSNNNTLADIPNTIVISTADDVYVSIIENNVANGNRSLNLALSDPAQADVFFLGGENIPLGVALDTITAAPMEIINNNLPHGTIGFSAANYTVDQNATNATITLTRTGGSAGTVTVLALTVPGGTAVAGTTNDYLSVSNVLTFGDSVTSLTFPVPVINNGISKPDATVFLLLTNITGGGIAGLTNSVLTIINDNFLPGHLEFTSANFGAKETDGSALITVSRTGGSAGSISVSCASSNGTATNGLNFSAATNILSWNAGDVSLKTFTVPVFHDGQVTSNLTVNLSLFNPVIGGSVNNAALGIQSNAVLTITNIDFYGQPTLSASAYNVNENAGFVTITVNRLGGAAQTMTVNYATGDGTALQNLNYTPTSGTLTFPPGVFSTNFIVPILDVDANPPIPNGNTAFTITLSNPTPVSGPGGGATLGTPSSATVTIVDNLTYNHPAGMLDATYKGSFDNTVYTLALQPNGELLAGGDFTLADGFSRSRIARLNSDGTLDAKFGADLAGADNSVRALVVQTDGAILIGGLFQTVDSVNNNFIARLNYDGSLDSTFDTAAGADSPVYAIAETFAGSPTNGANRRILIGGSFVSVQGFTSPNIAQLNEDGSVDTSFNSAGANGTVYAIAVYSTNDVNSGKILIGGDFSQVNGVPRNHIARLNADGTLDATFNPGAGANGSIHAIAIQVDGNIVIGGLFTRVGNSSLNYIARLTPNGLLDSAFNPGLGANNEVACLALQEDHKIIVGGTFTEASGVTRNRITRLNSDGSLDPAINFGSGANSFVSSVVIQQDDRIVLGGGFTQFNGASEAYIARLYGLTTPGPGTLSFSTANYLVDENASNALITVRRDGGTGDINIGNVYVQAATSDGSGVNGTDYIGVTNTLTFPVGEVFETFTVPIINSPVIESNRTVNLTLSNPTDAALGAQPTAILTIVNVNSDVSFSTPNYSVVKNVTAQEAVITITRNNSSVGVASIDVASTTNGTAIPGLDYLPFSNTVFFADGQVQTNFAVQILTNSLGGNRVIAIALVNPTNTSVGTPGTAQLTIQDNSTTAGDIMFASTNYSASELAGTATINLVRVGGSTGAVTITGLTTSGGTATPGVDYEPTNFSMSFGDGASNASFTVTLLRNPLATGNQTVNLTLTNVTGGAEILPPFVVPLTILDADTGFAFDSPAYFVDETNGSITIRVDRIGSTNGSFSVQYATADGTAVAGSNYVASSGPLNFSPGETFQTVTIPVFNDPQITGNLIFYVQLSSPSSPGQLVNPITTAVSILDDNIGLGLTTASNSVTEGTSNIVISVVRTGSPVGTVSVNFATSDGTATNGVRYFGTNGVLTFANGQISNSFSVGIINANVVEGDQTFNVTLSSPTGGAQLVAPSNEVVTVIDNKSAVSFSSAAYSVTENGVTALITAVRTGVVSNSVSVSFATSNLTAQAGIQYIATNGVLVFTNGQTTATFGIGIIDANVTGGSETIALQLSNPSTNLVLATPSQAVLTIFNDDGSLIVPAGSYLVSETGPGATNNVIYPGDTVTMLLALRNSAGTNTTPNFQATLLATNGVTAPSPSSPVNYGVLVTNGPSVSRQFQFTVSGSNGSPVNATLQMQDGTNNLGFAIFNFVLGQTTAYYTNGTYITINDDAAATPYPSPINVSSLNGEITKVTATVSNLGHAYVSDVCILLVGPGGQKDLLMTQAGGGHTITNVSLTFDVTVSTYLTTNSPISGTYAPTAFATNVPFPAPAPAGPYGTNFSNLLGANPAGTWSLYVFDDKVVDAGSINNGWVLGISSLNIAAPSVDLIAGMTASANPSVAGSNLIYTITVTNSGPAPASGVFLTNYLSAGVTVVSSNSSQGSGWFAGGSNIMICSLGGLATNVTATATLVINPPLVGAITNTVTAVANEADAFAADNTVSLVTVVTNATADLGVTMTDSPDPDLVGNTLTYTVTVTNIGPATAPNVVVTNTISTNITLTSIPGGSTASTNGGMVTISYGLGSIGSGGTASFVIAVLPTAPGLITNSASVSSDVVDPLKSNNHTSVKSEVEFVQLNLAHIGGSLSFSWPTNAVGYVLQFSPGLLPPTWTNVPNSPSVVNGQYVITIPVSAGPGFYRLSGPSP